MNLVKLCNFLLPFLLYSVTDTLNRYRISYFRLLLDYGLVVICSSESEDRANIVAALDQHRVAAPPCPSPEAVRGYFKKQFGIPPPQYGYINDSKIIWKPAGSLDPEK